MSSVAPPSPAAVPVETSAQPAKQGRRSAVSNALPVVAATAVIAGMVWLWKHRKGRTPRLDPFGAFIALLDLKAAPPVPAPLAPLPLGGLTFAVKDCFDVEGTVTGFGTPDWARTHPAATASAPAVAALQAAGARGIAKAHMDEMAFSLSGENDAYGTPTNPAVKGGIPGGSSSGSAVAVASQLVDLALGTDTAGSVRVPAALCGVYGFRPTHGRVSAIGVAPMAPSLDAVGLFARTPIQLRAGARVLLSLPPASGYAARPGRILIPSDATALVDDSQRSALAAAEHACRDVLGREAVESLDLGALLLRDCPALAQFVDSAPGVSPGLAALAAAQRALQGREFASAHSAWLDVTKPRFGADVTSRIQWAREVGENLAAAAAVAKQQAGAALAKLLAAEGTMLLLPTVPSSAPAKNSSAAARTTWRAAAVQLTAIAGMASLPQVTIPIEPADGAAPLAVSFIGRERGDAAVLDAACLLAPRMQEAHVAATAAESKRAAAATGRVTPAEEARESGNVAFKAGRWADALECYTTAVTLDKRSATALANRAMALINLARFDEAADDATAALALEPKNVKALLRRATARAVLGQYGAALEDYHAVLVLQPNNAQARSEINRMALLNGGEPIAHGAA